MKLLYDSYSDSEGMEDAEPYFLIHPDSVFAKYAEIFIAVLVLFSSTVTPLLLIYFNNTIVIRLIMINLLMEYFSSI